MFGSRTQLTGISGQSHQVETALEESYSADEEAAFAMGLDLSMNPPPLAAPKVADTPPRPKRTSVLVLSDTPEKRRRSVEKVVEMEMGKLSMEKVPSLVNEAPVREVM